MKSIFTFLASLLILVPAMGQRVLTPVPVEEAKSSIEGLQPLSRLHQLQQRHTQAVQRTTACSDDTLRYVAAKRQTNDTLRGITLNNNVQQNFAVAGQWFPAPDPMVLKGVGIYTLAGSSNPLNVSATIQVWDAGPDSLPTSVLHTENVTVSEQNNFKYFTFSQSVNVSGSYIISISNTTADPLVVVTTDPAVNSGRGEGLGFVADVTQQGLSVVRLLNANYDADFLIQPVVSYELDAAFTLTPECLNSGTAVTLNNTSSNTFSSRFYNLQVFLETFGSRQDSTFLYLYGDGNGAFGDSADVSHTFNITDSSSFNVSLDALLIGYGQVCSDLETQVYREAVSGGFTVSQTGADVTLTQEQANADSVSYDYGDGSGATEDTTHTYSQIGDYTITQIAFGCGGPDTTTQQVNVTTASVNRLSAGQVRIFPNPSQGFYTVELPQHATATMQLRVSNLMGQEVVSAQGIQRVTLDLSGQAPGVYLLQGRIGDQIFSQQLRLE